MTSGVSRRPLQPEQLASTTTHRPILDQPCRPTHPACAGVRADLPTGLGPRPSHRPPRRGDAMACTPARALRLGRRVSARHQPRFLGSGADELGSPAPLAACAQSARAVRASCWPTPACESFAPTRSARAPPVAQSPQCRSELRHRWPSTRPKPRRRHKRFRRTSPCFREKARSSRTPRSTCSRGPPAVTGPPKREAQKDRMETPCDTLARITQARSARLAAETARADQPPEVEGRLTHRSAKSHGIRRTRGAFHQ
jgi:hypothetical protein